MDYVAQSSCWNPESKNWTDPDGLDSHRAPHAHRLLTIVSQLSYRHWCKSRIVRVGAGFRGDTGEAGFKRISSRWACVQVPGSRIRYMKKKGARVVISAAVLFSLTAL